MSPKIKTTIYLSETMNALLGYLKYRTGETRSSIVDEALFLLAQKLDSQIFRELHMDASTSFIDIDKMIKKIKG